MSDTNEETDTSVETQEQPQVKYTERQMQDAIRGRVGKLTSKYEAQIAELQEKASQAEELSARLAALEEEKENAGKTASEKAQAAFQKQIEKSNREADDLRKALAEREQLAAQAQETLRNERAHIAVANALSSEKALNSARAAKYAMTDIRIEHTDEGMTATYGDVDEGSIAEAVKAWLKDNDNFLPVPSGGAGTRSSGGHGSRKPQDLSMDELLMGARRK